MRIAQPAKGVLARRRITNRAVAAAYGCSWHYVGKVLNGYEAPSRAFRGFLAGYLGVPADQLFCPEEELLVDDEVPGDAA